MKERARKSKSKLSKDNNSSSTYFMKLFEEMKEEKKKMAEKKVTYMEKNGGCRTREVSC